MRKTKKSHISRIFLEIYDKEKMYQGGVVGGG